MAAEGTAHQLRIKEGEIRPDVAGILTVEFVRLIPGENGEPDEAVLVITTGSTRHQNRKARGLEHKNKLDKPQGAGVGLVTTTPRPQ